MTIIDSCVFIAYFRIEEEMHNKAKKIIEETKNIFVNDYILSEIYTILLLRESQKIAQEAIAWIVTNPKIIVKRLSNNEIKEIINFIDNNKSKLSFIDISLLIMRQSSGYEIVSFDEEFNEVKK